jgi:hypothetical protein
MFQIWPFWRRGSFWACEERDLANGSGTDRDKAPEKKDLAEDGSSGVRSDMTRREAAEYIAGMLDGLQSIAQGANLNFIAYLLAMALEQAQEERSRED